jgi:uncharacterized membrane protein YkoI
LVEEAPMRVHGIRYLTPGLVAVILAVAACRADEEKVALDQLPKAVVEGLKAKYPNAEMVSAAKENEDGKTVYEVKIKNNGQKLEVKLSAEGKILEEENDGDNKDGDKKEENKAEKVAPDKLPKAVADAIKARFPNGEITSAEKETENGKVVYDIELKQGGRKYEMDLYEDGTVIEVEKEIKPVPEKIAKAIDAKYPKAEIEDVMEVNQVKGKEETPIHYEVTIKTAAGKKMEVLVSLDGTSVKTEEEAKKEKDKK